MINLFLKFIIKHKFEKYEFSGQCAVLLLQVKHRYEVHRRFLPYSWSSQPIYMVHELVWSSCTYGLGRHGTRPSIDLPILLDDRHFHEWQQGKKKESHNTHYDREHPQYTSPTSLRCMDVYWLYVGVPVSWGLRKNETSRTVIDHDSLWWRAIRSNNISVHIHILADATYLLFPEEECDLGPIELV